MLAPRCTISSLGNDFSCGLINPIKSINYHEWSQEKRYHEALDNPLVLEKIMNYVEYDDKVACYYFSRTLVYLGYGAELDINYINHILRTTSTVSTKTDYQKIKDILSGRITSYYCTNCFCKIKSSYPIDCISYRPLCDTCFEKLYDDHISEYEARTILLMLGYSRPAVDIACLAVEYTKDRKPSVIRRMNIRDRRDMKEGIMKGMRMLPFRRTKKSGSNVFLRRHIVQLDYMYIGRRSTSNFVSMVKALSDVEDCIGNSYLSYDSFQAHLVHNILEENEWVLQAMRKRFNVDFMVWDGAINNIKARLQDFLNEKIERKKDDYVDWMVNAEGQVTEEDLKNLECKLCGGKCAKLVIRQEKYNMDSSQKYNLSMVFGCNLSPMDSYTKVYGYEKKPMPAFVIKRKKELRALYFNS